MLILAFDTATDLATSALVADGVTLGERTTRPQSLLADVDALLKAAGVVPADLTGIVVGTAPAASRAPGSASPWRAGSRSRSTCPWPASPRLRHSPPGRKARFPVVDARRGEVFVPGPLAVRPDELVIPPGSVLVGDGACRYRDLLVARGAEVPPADSVLHVPRAALHASLATAFGPAEAVEPVYVREPDATRWVA